MPGGLGSSGVLVEVHRMRKRSLARLQFVVLVELEKQ